MAPFIKSTSEDLTNAGERLPTSTPARMHPSKPPPGYDDPPLYTGNGGSPYPSPYKAVRPFHGLPHTPHISSANELHLHDMGWFVTVCERALYDLLIIRLTGRYLLRAASQTDSGEGR